MLVRKVMSFIDRFRLQAPVDNNPLPISSKSVCFYHSDTNTNHRQAQENPLKKHFLI
jgi:hypothetical protein